MSRVYLARGHGRKPDGGFDPGAVGKDSSGFLWTEQKMADIAVPHIADILLKAGVTVEDEGTDDPNFIGSTSAANSWNADLTVSVHADWTGGWQFHVIHYPTSTEGKRCAESIRDAVAAAGVELHSDSVQGREELYILRKTRMPAVLVEMGRIGSAEIDTAEEIKARATHVAHGILDYLGVDRPAPPAPEPDESEWKYPTAAQLLLDADIYSKWTGPGHNVDTDNLSAYLARMLHFLEKEIKRLIDEAPDVVGLTESEVVNTARRVADARIEAHAEDRDAHHGHEAVD